MQNLIRICIADAAQNTWICQGSFESAIFGDKRRAKLIEIDRENLNAAGIDGSQLFFIVKQVQGRAAFRTGLGQNEGTI